MLWVACRVWKTGAHAKAYDFAAAAAATSRHALRPAHLQPEEAHVLLGKRQLPCQQHGLHQGALQLRLLPDVLSRHLRSIGRAGKAGRGMTGGRDESDREMMCPEWAGMLRAHYGPWRPGTASRMMQAGKATRDTRCSLHTAAGNTCGGGMHRRTPQGPGSAAGGCSPPTAPWSTSCPAAWPCADAPHPETPVRGETRQQQNARVSARRRSSQARVLVQVLAQSNPWPTPALDCPKLQPRRPAAKLALSAPRRPRSPAAA